jgi:hypothetical protein
LLCCQRSTKSVAVEKSQGRSVPMKFSDVSPGITEIQRIISRQSHYPSWSLVRLGGWEPDKNIFRPSIIAKLHSSMPSSPLCYTGLKHIPLAARYQQVLRNVTSATAFTRVA